MTRRYGVWAAWLAACVVVSQLSRSRGFYIPGVAPTEYHQHERLEIKVAVCAGRGLLTTPSVCRADGRSAVKFVVIQIAAVTSSVSVPCVAEHVRIWW